MLKYYNYDIVFQEVPDEVTLAVNLSNCPNHCPGCHSPHLCKDIGNCLDEETISNMISKYNNSITCFCFMGGDANQDEVIKMAEFVHKTFDKKVAWYSGKQTFPKDITPFQYLKLGPYNPKYGGLDKKTTNQRMYKIYNTKPIDITNRFWRKAM